MSIVVTLEAEIKPGETDNLLNLLSKHLRETRKYPGFVDISIHLEKDSQHVLFYQNWQRFEDYDYEAYLGWRAETGVLAELKQKLRSEPVIRYFENANI